MKLLLALALACGSHSDSAPSPSPAPPVPVAAPKPLPVVPAGLPAPPDHGVTAEEIATGERLFSDTKLASNGLMSCATCHDPAHDYSGKVDKTVTGERNLRRTPALVNLAWQHEFGWDGRYPALDVLLSAHARGQLGAELDADKRVALAAFLWTRYDGASPWDARERDATAHSGDPLDDGYKIFTGKAQCAVCHPPPLYTDFAYHAVAKSAFADPGRGKVDSTRVGAFKTPTLRGAAARPAFFHGATAETLDDVVDWYVSGQAAAANPSEPVLGNIHLTPDERAHLIAFVRSLTGEPAMTLRDDIEVAVGGVQLRAIERAVATAARVRLTRTPDDAVSYFVRAGRGLPIVGIHGFGGDKETWLLMAALVRRRGACLIDLPGHGASADVPESKASIRHHAEAVIRVLDHAGVDRALVCGNSMGGGVALRLAMTWPDRVAGLVLVASVGRDVHDGAANQWVDGDNPLIPREEDIDRFMALALERPPPVGRAVIRHVVTQRARAADKLHKLFRGFISATGDDGVPRDLRTIAIPALVIHGEQDRIIDKRVAEDLTLALPRAELVVMRGVGHAPQLEAPRHTARLVEQFARRIE